MSEFQKYQNLIPFKKLVDRAQIIRMKLRSNDDNDPKYFMECEEKFCELINDILKAHHKDKSFSFLYMGYDRILKKLQSNLDYLTNSEHIDYYLRFFELLKKLRKIKREDSKYQRYYESFYSNNRQTYERILQESNPMYAFKNVTSFFALIFEGTDYMIVSETEAVPDADFRSIEEYNDALEEWAENFDTDIHIKRDYIYYGADFCSERNGKVSYIHPVSFPFFSAEVFPEKNPAKKRKVKQELLKIMDILKDHLELDESFIKKLRRLLFNLQIHRNYHSIDDPIQINLNNERDKVLELIFLWYEPENSHLLTKVKIKIFRTHIIIYPLPRGTKKEKFYFSNKLFCDIEHHLNFNFILLHK